MSATTPSLSGSTYFGRPRSASSASRPRHATDASSMAPSISSWAHSVAPSQPTPTSSRRASLLATLTFSLRRPASKRGPRQTASKPESTYSEVYEDDVMDITAAPTEDELERERLRTAAAQAVGLTLQTSPSPPPIPAPPPPLQPFPSTRALLSPRATLSATVSKRSAHSGFLGRTQWKQRLVMLTTRNMHALVGQTEVERLALMASSVAFVADDEPGMGGRKSIIKLGTEAEWWTIQMRDAAQMHAWLQAIKAAVAALRPRSPDSTVSSHFLAPPVLRVLSTTPTSPTFPPFGSGSTTPSPASSTRLSRTRSAAPAPTTAAALKSLLSTRRLSVGRRRSPSDPGNGFPVLERSPNGSSISAHTVSGTVPVGPEILGRRIYEPAPMSVAAAEIPLPMSPPRSPSPKLSSRVIQPQPQAPQSLHQHTMSLPPPPRPRRQRPVTSPPLPSPPHPPDIENPAAQTDRSVDENSLPLPEFRTAPKMPPSPELVLRDLPVSAFRHSRVSVVSGASVGGDSDRDVEQEHSGPTVKHPYGATNGTTSKGNKRLSTSSALSAGSGASGSSSGRFLRPGHGSGGMPPQRPPPVGSLPPTPVGNGAPSPPPTGPLPTPPSLPASSSSPSPPPLSVLPPVPGSMSNRRSVRMSLSPANALPPSLPPSGPLPPTPTQSTDRSRIRNSVTFATSPESSLSRSSSIREGSNAPSHSRTSSFGPTATSIVEEGSSSQPTTNGHTRTESASSSGTTNRKRVSLKLRFKSSPATSTPPDASTDTAGTSFLMPITPSSAGSPRAREFDATPTHERGMSFLSPYTPAEEHISFINSFPPPMPSPLPSDLFTILPGMDYSRGAVPPPLPSPTLFPPPEQPLPTEPQPLRANELFSSIRVPNRGRAGSLSTLEMDAPEPRSLSPPPPRRNRSSMTSTIHSKRASIGSIGGLSRRSDHRVRGSVDSALAVPGVTPKRTSGDSAAIVLGTGSRPHTASSDATHSLASSGDVNPLPERPLEEDEKPEPVKPRISMDGELLDDAPVEHTKQDSDDDNQHDSGFDSAIHLPLHEPQEA
ncbi:hypothetical protein EXIGLDRAFT_735907 [Exidia glandulosa HHB12029]|uniref:PH domain-containing protein n=1 Tax=Exidia glandulosa HHB12029 TaxID=1314781 RepID=A0A165JP28_EXIGL|nr:hypothetical protein EXIGLDRAFT_735907 [Exidia glandulosa HHB12029]